MTKYLTLEPEAADADQIRETIKELRGRKYFLTASSQDAALPRLELQAQPADGLSTFYGKASLTALGSGKPQLNFPL